MPIKKLFILIFMLIVLLCSQYVLAAKWTFMVYLDGDNNLESYALDDFMEMAQVGSNSDINIVVQMDRISGYDSSYDNWTTTKRFLVTKDATPTSASALADLGEINMADPANLTNFIQWSVTNYPADNYALILWNHGGGWRASDLSQKSLRAVVWDDSSGNDCLYMSEVKQAIANSGTHLSLVGFDACLMGMVEVAYALRTRCDVMVGSQEVEPGDGWPYHTILGDLAANPNMTAAQLGTSVVNRYGSYYGTVSYCTQTAFDMSKLSDLATKIDTFADSMNWASGNAQWNKVTLARNNCTSYYYDSTNFIDIYRFCDQVKQNVTDTTVQNNAEAVKTSLTSAIIANYAGSYEDAATSYGSHGLSFYFPKTSSDYNSAGDYPGYEESNTSYPVDYVNDHTWDNFIKRCYSGFTPPSDTYEPNDSISSAYGFLISGMEYESYIYTSSDVDYYKINVTTTGVITIDLTSLPGDYDLYFYNSSSALLDASTNGGTMSESISYTATSTGTYYIKVVGWAGAYSNSDSYILKATLPNAIPPDTTPPTGTPAKPATTSSFATENSITFSWTQGTAADAESNIASYYLQVSTDTSFSTFACNEDIGNLLTKKISNCTQGLTYYARVKAKNGVGLFTDWSATSDSVLVDMTPPVIGDIRDGTSQDIDVSYSTTSISANWDAAQDPENSISKYYYAIGTKPGGRDIVDWTDNGSSLSITRTGLSLQNSTTYYVTVKAENSSGLISPAYYQEKTAANGFLGTGTAQNWKEDDKSWSYTLPFEFNFYGNNYSAVYIDSNGYLNFISSGSIYNNTQQVFEENVMIAPLWEPLTTAGSAQAGEDIYIHQPDANSVCIRWRAETEAGSHPVNFEIILYRDGKIHFNYGSENTNLNPLIGISKGDKYSYVSSIYSHSASMTNASTIEFFRTSSNGQVPFRSPLGKASKPTSPKRYTNSPVITFTWEKGDLENNITGYEVQASTTTSFNACHYTGCIDNVLSTEIPQCADNTTYYARVRARNVAELYSEWSEASDPVTVDLSSPTCAISISPSAPVKTGSLAITLTITDANPIFQTPSLACLLPGSAAPVSIPLSGSDKVWAGTFYIESTMPNGVATFQAALTDAAGNIGATITSGSSFIINKQIKGSDGGTVSNADGTAIEIPFALFDNDTSLDVVITKPDATTGIIAAAFTKTINDNNIKIISSDNTARSFTLSDANSGQVISSLSGSVTVTIPYYDTDQNGYVDGTDISEDSLRIFYLNETNKRWILEKDMQLNTVKNTVSCAVNHLSTFCIMGYVDNNIKNLDKTYCYPNPCYSGKGQQIKIVNLPIDNTEVYIYNLAGELIRILKENEEIEVHTLSETATWDLKNESGEPVASGLYFYTIKTNSKHKAGKAIAVIK